MAVRAVTEGNLGAWLLKCDPRVNPELLTTAGAGVVRVTSRCVVPGYRAAMMQEGDRVVLWVSGDGRRLARGIWGLGQVTGVVEEQVDARTPVVVGGARRVEAEHVTARSDPGGDVRAAAEQRAYRLPVEASGQFHAGPEFGHALGLPSVTMWIIRIIPS
jgi:hypothetical protein